MSEPIDYRALLVKYISEVLAAEGTDFLPAGADDITTAEAAELEACSREALRRVHDQSGPGGRP